VLQTLGVVGVEGDTYQVLQTLGVVGVEGDTYQVLQTLGVVGVEGDTYQVLQTLGVVGVEGDGTLVLLLGLLEPVHVLQNTPSLQHTHTHTHTHHVVTASTDILCFLSLLTKNQPQSHMIITPAS